MRRQSDWRTESVTHSVRGEYGESSELRDVIPIDAAGDGLGEDAGAADARITGVRRVDAESRGGGSQYERAEHGRQQSVRAGAGHGRWHLLGVLRRQQRD